MDWAFFKIWNQNINCLWRKEIHSRTDFVESSRPCLTSNPIAWHPQYQAVMPLLSIMNYHDLSRSILICDGLWVYFYHDPLSKTAFYVFIMSSSFRSSCFISLLLFLSFGLGRLNSNSHIFPVPATQHLVGPQHPPRQEASHPFPLDICCRVRTFAADQSRRRRHIVLILRCAL